MRPLPGNTAGKEGVVVVEFPATSRRTCPAEGVPISSRGELEVTRIVQCSEVFLRPVAEERVVR